MPNTNDTDPPKPFAGFRGPHYTQVPDALFDELLPELTGSELKVLLYIMRRTFGFKRNSDSISISQMLDGIVKRDGTRLDHGAGVTKKTLLRALRSLEERQIIFATRRSSSEKGHEPTVYELNVVADRPLGGKTPPRGGAKFPQGGGGKTPPSPRGKNSPIQEREEQKTVLQETDKNISNIRKVKNAKEATTAGPEHPELSSVGDVLEARSIFKQTSDPRPETLDEDYQTILEYIQDRAREFNDTAPLKSSTTRAYRLYKQSGLPIAAFIDRIFQARSITQERTASITKTASDPSSGVRKSKMAYFFAVLEDHVQGKEKAQKTETEAPRAADEDKKKGDWDSLVQR